MLDHPFRLLSLLVLTAALNALPGAVEGERLLSVDKHKPAAEPWVAEAEPVGLGEFKLTYYCACERCCGCWSDGITATGTRATEGRTVAVDPEVIPLGSTVVIDGHAYIAEDTGARGRHIDIYMESHEACIQAGVGYEEVFIRDW